MESSVAMEGQLVQLVGNQRRDVDGGGRAPFAELVVAGVEHLLGDGCHDGRDIGTLDHTKTRQDEPRGMRQEFVDDADACGIGWRSRCGSRSGEIAHQVVKFDVVINMQVPVPAQLESTVEIKGCDGVRGVVFGQADLTLERGLLKGGVQGGRCRLLDVENVRCDVSVHEAGQW